MATVFFLGEVEAEALAARLGVLLLGEVGTEEKAGSDEAVVALSFSFSFSLWW